MTTPPRSVGRDSPPRSVGPPGEIRPVPTRSASTSQGVRWCSAWASPGRQAWSASTSWRDPRWRGSKTRAYRGWSASTPQRYRAWSASSPRTAGRLRCRGSPRRLPATPHAPRGTPIHGLRLAGWFPQPTPSMCGTQLHRPGSSQSTPTARDARVVRRIGRHRVLRPADPWPARRRHVRCRWPANASHHHHRAACRRTPVRRPSRFRVRARPVRRRRGCAPPRDHGPNPPRRDRLGMVRRPSSHHPWPAPPISRAAPPARRRRPVSCSSIVLSSCSAYRRGPAPSGPCERPHSVARHAIPLPW